MSVPPHRSIPHYHGDSVRAIFVASALILFVAQSTAAILPLSTNGAVGVAVMLIIAAGITNPAQVWIHYANAFLAGMGAITFGISAVSHSRAGAEMFDPSFIYVELLSVLSLIALYLGIRTIRGFVLRESRR